MPRLPDIDGARAVPVSRRGITEDASGRILAEGISRAAEDIGQIAAERKARADHFAALKAENQFLQADIEARRSLEGDRDWQTHESRYRESALKALGEAGKVIVDEGQRQEFDLRARMRIESGVDAVRTRARAIEADTGRADLQSALDANRTAALEAGDEDTQRALVSNTLDLLASARDSEYIDADVAQRMQKAWTLDFAKGYIDTLEPIDRIAVLENPGQSPAAFLDADERAVLLRQARGEIDSGITEARQVMNDRLRDIGAAAQAGIPIDEVPDKATLQALFGEHEGTQKYQAAQAAANLAAAVANMHTMPTDELVQQAQSFEPTQVEGAAEQSQIAGFVANRTAAVIKEREADPAGYLVTYSPSVREAWTAMQEDPEAGPGAYLRTLRAERERLGVPGEDVVPAAYAASIADTVSSAKAEDLATTFETLASQWGPAWPQLYGQIAEDVPDMALVIGAGIPRSAAVALASTAGLKDTELRGMLPPNVVWADVERSVAEEFADFTSSLPVDAARTNGAVREAAARLAVKYMNDGSSVSDAVVKARQDLVDSQYNIVEFRGSMIRMPVDLDPDQAETSARDALRNYRPAPGALLDAGQGSATAQEEYESRYADYVRDNGYWLTNPASTGIRLYVDGGPVAGHPDVTWNELMAPAVDAAERQRRILERSATTDPAELSLRQ